MMAKKNRERELEAKLIGMSADEVLQGIRTLFDHMGETITTGLEIRNQTKAYATFQGMIEEAGKALLLIDIYDHKVSQSKAVSEVPAYNYRSAAKKFYNHSGKTALLYLEMHKVVSDVAKGDDRFTQILNDISDLASRGDAYEDRRQDQLYVSLSGNIFKNPKQILTPEMVEHVKQLAVFGMNVVMRQLARINGNPWTDGSTENALWSFTALVRLLMKTAPRSVQ